MKSESKKLEKNCITVNADLQHKNYDSTILQSNITFPNTFSNVSNYNSTINNTKRGLNLSLYFEKPKKPYYSFYLIRNKIKDIKQHKKEFLKSFYSHSIQKSYDKKKYLKTMNINNINNISKINTIDINNNNNSSNLYSRLDTNNYNQNSAATAFSSKIKHNIIYTNKSTINTKDHALTIGSSHDNNRNALSTRYFLNKSNKKTNNNSKSTGKEINSDKNNINFGESEIKRPITEYYGEKLKPLKSKNRNTASFLSSEINLSIKAKYINHCLKIVEYDNMRKTELNEERLRVEISSLIKLHKLITKFSDEFSNYYRYILQTLHKEKTYNEFLKFDIIKKRNEMNDIFTKKNKLLLKYDNYLDIKSFLTNVKMYHNKQVNILNQLLNNESTKYSYHKIFFSIHEEFKRNRQKLKTIRIHRLPSMLSFEKIKFREISPEKKSKKNVISFTSNKRLNNYKSISSNKRINKKEIKRRTIRIESFNKNNIFLNRENKLVFNSADDFINTFANIKHNIGTLLMFKTKLENEIEPLRTEYKNVYDSIEEFEHRYRKEVKIKLIIVPQKLKMVKERNKFLIDKLKSIKLNGGEISFDNKYTKIESQLKIIYNNILQNDILPICKNQEEVDDKFYSYKKMTDNLTFQNIFFYLHKIEVACDILNISKVELRQKFNKVYYNLKKELFNRRRMNNFENLKREEYKIKKMKAKLMIERLNKIPMGTKGLDYYINEKAVKKQKIKPDKKKMDFSEEVYGYLSK